MLNINNKLVCFKNGAYNEAMSVCSEVLEVDENNIDALCDRAEVQISNEMYEAGVECGSLIRNLYIPCIVLDIY